MSPPLVIAYHGLGEVPFVLDPSGLMVPVVAFRRQVRRLRKRGYRFVPQSELARRLAAGDSVDDLCSLTFDDAPQDNATTLLAVLDELELPATVYACPELLGKPWPFIDARTGIRLCDEAQLRTVADHPRVEIGSHTRHHTELDASGPKAAREEMVESKRDLEALLGIEVLSFAYPACGYSADCPAAAAATGYTSAVTCGPRGTSTEPFEMARASPAPSDGPLTFELKTRGKFFAVRDQAAVRLARRALRPMRWR
ncbi:MAG: polysaccharide deacetylase family protein [Thermoleophilaceae bacterium]